MGRTTLTWIVGALLLAASPALAGKKNGADGKKVKVTICHIPPGNPDNQRTVRVAESAVAAHLAHGDALGECGVVPADDPVVDPVVIEADAGADVVVFESDVVEVVGSATILSGDYDGDLVFEWTQVGGDPVDYESTSPPLFVDTTGAFGDLVFRLTVSTLDGSASASDEFTLTVEAVTIVEVNNGGTHAIARLSDDTIKIWGSNRFGELGDGSITTAVSADPGIFLSIVAKEDGTAWTFGWSALADDRSPVPVQVPLDDVVQVSASLVGGMLLRADGTLWGFEQGNCELGLTGGEGSSTQVYGPLQIPGLPSNIVSFSMGGAHSVAVDANGTAWTWGWVFGCEPWPVLDGVVAVSAGNDGHSLFLKSDGTVWAIGFNLHGQLGNGTKNSNYNTPTQVVGLNDVVAVSAGTRHSLFLRADGTVYSCGWNKYGALGIESDAQPVDPLYGQFAPFPTPVFGLTDVKLIAAGGHSSLFVKADDTIWVSGATLASLPLNVVFTPTQIELND